MRLRPSGLIIARSGRVTDQDLRVSFIVFDVVLGFVSDIEAFGM